MRRLTLLLLSLLLPLGAACSAHSLDYLSSGYAPDPPLPPGSPVENLFPDAGARPDAPAAPAATPDAAPAVAPPDAAPDRPRDQGGTPDLPTADSAPEAAAPREVFFIVGSVPLPPADLVLERRLRMLNLQVVTVVDNRLGTVDTARADLILISPTVGVMNIGARFRDVPQPVVVSEPLLYDDMGMVESTVAMNINRGTDMGVTTLRIEQAESPLAAGLTGDVVVARQGTALSWGTPNQNAVRVASVPGQMTHTGLMAYEAGTRMPELTAPARRVGLFLSDQTASVLTQDGFALLDAAILWALQP
jgi:hypothetical protein